MDVIIHTTTGERYVGISHDGGRSATVKGVGTFHRT